jgi:hypothetical protein
MEKWGTLFGNVVWQGKIHICAQYGHIIINYDMDMTITLVIGLEKQECHS